MRLGRIILLASLAQLLGLSALAAAISEHPAFPKDAETSSENPVWKALFTPTANDVTITTATHDRPSSVAVLALTALAETPLRHAVWMVMPAVRTVEIPRPRRYASLR
ncbi:MAG: hypothetical protein RL328_1043, partial [Acidobacteriota bacterium]